MSAATWADSGRAPTRQRRAVDQLARLTMTEAKLVAREPLVLAFVFFFPVVFTLVLGGVFDPDDDAFGALPSDYYGVAYIAVAIGAVGLTMIPVQVASYRERGVLRRFATSGVPAWAFPTAMVIVAVVLSMLAAALVVATTVLTHGLSAPEDPAKVAIFGVLAIVSFSSFGLAIGWLMPTARSAQGIGILLFFPMFLLGGGGPPPDALSPTMNSIAQWLPLTHVMRAIQEPWLDLDGGGNGHVVILAALGITSTAIWLRLATARGGA